MSNRLFQGIIHQMKDAVDRVIGVIDENGYNFRSDLSCIGETRQGIRDELAYTRCDNLRRLHLQTDRCHRKPFILCSSKEKTKAPKIHGASSIALANIKNLYDEK